MADCGEIPRNWRALYQAALFESDSNKLANRVAEARNALMLRSRELFAASPLYDGETEDMENALYALQALESCLKSNTNDRRRSARTA